MRGSLVFRYLRPTSQTARRRMGATHCRLAWTTSHRVLVSEGSPHPPGPALPTPSPDISHQSLHMISSLTVTLCGSVRNQHLWFSFLAGPLMRVLVSVLAPIYWTTVLQRGAARNGYSFTHGQFRQESQVEFDTGESGMSDS